MCCAVLWSNLVNLRQELGWLSIPVSMIVSFLLFGIEEIGVQVEEVRSTLHAC